MSIFSEFDLLRDSVNRMMGDFAATGGLGGTRRGRRRAGFGYDPFGTSLLDDDWLDVPLMLTSDIGGGIPQGQLTSGKGGEETKMEDVPSSGGQLTERPRGTQMTTFQPNQFLRARVNIEDQKDKYIVTADVPGFDKSNIKVNVTDDGLLHIKGEQTKEWVDQSKDKNYIRAERNFSNISRSLRLPRGVDASKITANYENGVLHVTLPKTEEQQKKTSEIQIQ